MTDKKKKESQEAERKQREKSNAASQELLVRRLTVRSKSDSTNEPIH